MAVIGLTAACSVGPPAGGAGPPPAQPPATTTPSPIATPTPRPRLSLAGLFHPLREYPADGVRVRTLVVTGDVIPARQVNVESTRRGDFLWPFRPTADFVRNADITYSNLESPLLAGCPVTSQGFQFCGDTRFVNGLTFSGVKVVNLANNHAGNYGSPGVDSTVQLLERNGIRTSGLGPVAVIEVRGIRFGFVGFNGVGVKVDREAVRLGIAHAREQADIVVVQFHWGKEYERQPLPDPAVPTPDDPVELGHLAIDEGADLVIGNHPHWYQGVEVYRDHLITYAHGNFVFDQMWSEETRQGVIGTYTFFDRRLVGAAWRPVRIYDYGQPRFEDAAYDQRVLGTMEQASRDLAARLGESP